MERNNLFRHCKAVLLLAVALSVKSVSVSALRPGPQPVQWSFITRQLSPTVFEVHVIASIQEGWRFLNQTSAETAPVMGKLLFAKHPNVVLVSKMHSGRSGGQVSVKTQLGDSTCYHDNEVRISYLVQLIRPGVTNLPGEVVYTLTNEQQHTMLQDKISFSVLLR